MSRGSARRSMADYAVATHAQGTSDGDRRMERYHEYVGRRRSERTIWPGAAFIVEALLLLVFLTGSLAVLMELNADADAAGRQSADLMGAMTMASNAAETFAASPLTAAESFASNANADDPNIVRQGGLVLVRDVQPEKMAAGVLYHASIAVWRASDVTAVEPAQGDGGHYQLTLADRTVEPVYTLETTVYVPETAEGEVSHG